MVLSPDRGKEDAVSLIQYYAPIKVINKVIGQRLIKVYVKTLELKNLTFLNLNYVQICMREWINATGLQLLDCHKIHCMLMYLANKSFQLQFCRFAWSVEFYMYCI